MSTLKVNTIQDTTGNDALTIDTSGNVTASQGFVPSTQLSHRNLFSNGAMQVAQRSTSQTGVTSGGYQTVDRWNFLVNSMGTYTITQSTDSPNGFGHSWKIQCTTADASPATSDELWLRNQFEGYEVQCMAKGTSDAKQVTLSFWVKCNKTGNIQVNIRDLENSRQVSGVITINSADTWEHKTHTFPADTTGTITSDNSGRLSVEWWLDSGTDSNSGSTQTSWATRVNADRAVGTTISLADSTSNYIAFTGMQFEIGSVATPYEHRSYDDELQRCYRYFQKTSDPAKMTMWSGNCTSGQNYFHGVSFFKPMRTAPTMNPSGQGGAYFNGITAANANIDGFWIGGTCDYTGSAGYWYCRWEADAEL